ncbi:A24 family peptidase [uncultured Tateyamaria sp.]|uniref:prepilin peptidase n=1 Tax=uncultured Tateyamaria sp. TaxID=455651 RepID=UPI002639588A|nr:A24 family peptidase [uncultured Tateyamaria sp.]
MLSAWPLSLFLILISPAIGSFLAVLVDRLPRGEDVVRRPSACRSCGTALGVGDLVPLASFIWRRGRCGHCAAPIPPWLFYMEIAATGLALLAVLEGDTPGHMIGTAVILWLLLALAVSDLMWFRLPDLLTGGLALVALAMAPDPRAAFLGAGLGVMAFAALRRGYRIMRKREGLGLGDVKLMAGLGAFVGLTHLPLLVLLGAVTAIAVALAGAWRQGRYDATRPLPFGTALCAAAFALWLVGLA